MAKRNNVTAIRDHYNQYTNDKIEKLDFNMIAEKKAQNKDYVSKARESAQPIKYTVVITK